MHGKLAFKIPFAYFLVIFFTLTISYSVLSKISSDSEQQKISEASIQTITSIQTNIDSMIGNVNNYSKMIFSDNNLQNLLRQGDVYSNLQTQTKVSQYLYNLIETVPIIDTVYIFDNTGHCFSVGSQTSPALMKADVKEAPWYREVVRDRGNYILKLNGGGAFSSSSGGNYISFIRLIRDINNTAPLGILVINIPESAFVQTYSDVIDDNPLQIFILDENDQIIVPNPVKNKSVQLFKQMVSEKAYALPQKLHTKGSGSLTARSQAQKYLISYIADGDYNWKYISMMPYNMINSDNRSLEFLAFMLLLVNGAVFFVSSVIVSRSIINPVHLLLQSMKDAKSGSLSKIEAEPNNFEFEQLFAGYNKMVGQINQLLIRVVQEQNTIRKAELNTLQAQIKPHFLYNALDSITSLALSGDNEQVCELVDALGSYYRMSVSKGREIISIGEEVEMIRNYLKIQKVRYLDLFEVKYDIDETCCRYPILKLVLQPLVENSLYHGIRSKGSAGNISVGVSDAGKYVSITVADDGVGMSKEEIYTILTQEKNGKIKSFGLWGTMERIRIFYGSDDCFKIESTPDIGTRITLLIPKREGEAWNS